MTDYTLDESPKRTARVYWPEPCGEAPDGWCWGAHVSLGNGETGYWLIRSRDDRAVIAITRPDMDDAPSDADLDAALEASNG